jgi:choline dehydrogenase-like flavoprotein
MALTDEARRRERMLSYYMNFDVIYADDDVYDALAHLRNSFFEPFDRSVLNAAGRIVGDLPAALRITQEESGSRPRQMAYLRLQQRIDQAPNPQSRITLTSEHDALGLPKINLHWDITDLDVHSWQRGQEIMLRELSALGFGRFAVEPITADLARANVVGHYHHMGTTRMSASPRDGVVDADCKVHGVENLFVAGSSTFPTGGSSGPTMTIIAMAIRLADHLRQRA